MHLLSENLNNHNKNLFKEKKNKPTNSGVPTISFIIVPGRILLDKPKSINLIFKSPLLTSITFSG